MAQSTTAARPARLQLVGPRQTQALDLVRQVSGDGGFDIDAWHVMEERDNQLIADEILHGAGSSTFVYSFEIQSKTVAGISVIGARHLAHRYGGMKHRLVAGMQKTGELFVFTSYPAENMPMQVSCSMIAELEQEEDFYQQSSKFTTSRPATRSKSSGARRAMRSAAAAVGLSGRITRRSRSQRPIATPSSPWCRKTS